MSSSIIEASSLSAAAFDDWYENVNHPMPPFTATRHALTHPGPRARSPRPARRAISHQIQNPRPQL